MLHSTVVTVDPSVPQSRPNEWQAFVDALQVLVIVADAAARQLTVHTEIEACREVVSATHRVLELTPRVMTTHRARGPLSR